MRSRRQFDRHGRRSHGGVNQADPQRAVLFKYNREAVLPEPAELLDRKRRRNGKAGYSLRIEKKHGIALRYCGHGIADDLRFAAGRHALLRVYLDFMTADFRTVLL